MASGSTRRNRSPERIPKAEPWANLCLLSFRKESKCPPRHEGQALRQQNFNGAPPGEKNKFSYVWKIRLHLAAAKPHLITPSQRERSENARRQTGQQSLFSDQARRVGIFNGAPFWWLVAALAGTVPQTDSKGALWRAFDSFRLVAKGSARPGMRGKPAPAEFHGEPPERKTYSFTLRTSLVLEKKTNSLTRKQERLAPARGASPAFGHVFRFSLLSFFPFSHIIAMR